MKCLYPSIPELASNTDPDFVKSAPYDWRFGFGHVPAYIEYSDLWESLYYNGLISKREYINNPFPL